MSSSTPVLRSIRATVDLTQREGRTLTFFEIENIDEKPVSVKATVTRPGGADLVSRPWDAAPTGIARRKPGKQPASVGQDVDFEPNERRIVEAAYTGGVFGDKTKSFVYIPDMTFADTAKRAVDRFDVEFTLPPSARKVVALSAKHRVTTDAAGRLRAKVSLTGAVPGPLVIKWTELDVDVRGAKTVKTMRNNRIQVSLRLKNHGERRATGLVLCDTFSPADASPLASSARGFRVLTEDASDQRFEWTARTFLEPGETKTFNYTIVATPGPTSVPPTVVRKAGHVVAVLGEIVTVQTPPAFPAPAAAFALPSGWSFDYKHGGDHHINEHGMWSTGQDYDLPRQRLDWTTNAVYCDKNFDDDYRWGPSHSILRFNPGLAYHGETSWVAKAGAVTSHSDSFVSADLRQFTQAIVLLRGWRFDYTSEDHHINKVSIRVDTTSFNRRTGEVKWTTRATYADKNFDDNYRFRYWYTILGFNGEWEVVTRSGDDAGGSEIDAYDADHAGLKGFTTGFVVPVGWSFDYKDTDHHIDEHSFSIRNDRYTSSSGRYRFTASLNYSDKNRDDDYSWRYDAALIATNQGGKRVHEPGVYYDGGGIDSEPFSVDLDAFFSPITWTNGVMDGDETGVDSGGSSPARNLGCAQSTSVNPGNASSSEVFNLKTSADRATLMTFANSALVEYYESDTWGTPNPDFDTFYSGPTKGDRYVEAVAWWVNEHMEWVEDGGDWDGKQKALRTLLESGHRGGGDFNGDCEDHAILRAALLRVLGFKYTCIFCADHHNSVDQGQWEEAGSTGKKKNSGGHTYNVVVYQGKYRILDYGPMQDRNWSDCWDQHATDNIWNDHTGQHWSSQDVTPFGGSDPLVNYPGNPSSPTSNWDWRTYFNDISP